MRKKPLPPLAHVVDPEESALFRNAVRDAVPLPEPDRVSPTEPIPQPFPVQSLINEYDGLFEPLHDEPLSWEDSLESGEALSFLRDGLSRQILKKLRHGHWAVQACVDLHGMTRDEARNALGAFLATAKSRGYRCVRIIHGKGLGSKNREPVLKAKIKTWLARYEDVLAYCQAPDRDGGAGATLMLLRA